MNNKDNIYIFIFIYIYFFSRIDFISISCNRIAEEIESQEKSKCINKK